MKALVERIRALLAGRTGVTEQLKMGGTTFLVDGKVCVRCRGHEIMVRCRPGDTDKHLAAPGVKRLEMKGRTNMKGWLIVDEGAVTTEEQLGFWVGAGLDAVDVVKPARRKA